MHESSIILTFVAGLSAALLLGFVAKKLSISPIIGYLLAGIVIGPFTPGFSANYEVANQFAEIGVILLLFGIGLRFELKELFAVWTIALPGALIQSALSTLLAASLLYLTGWDWISGLIFGAAISVASTVVMVLILKENHDLYSPIGHIAVGWTVVEDILTVILLLLLPILFNSQSIVQQDFGMQLGIASLKIILLLIIMVILSKWVLPFLFEKIERTKSGELFTLTVIVVAIGIAVISSSFFGVSIALGAFLAGLAVGRSEYGLRAAGESLPLKDVFSVLFFVSVGMLANPRSIVETPLLIGLIIIVVIIIKPLISFLLVRIMGKPLAVSIPVGAAFGQIGEFSFILGALAKNLGLLNDTGWNVLVVVSIVSIVLNPFVYKLAARIAKRYNKLELPETNESENIINPSDCIIIGYGPVGKIVHQLLAEQSLNITIIDLNLETIRRLKDQGYSAIYGDVLRHGTLEEAGIAKAGTLIISVDIKDSSEIIRQALKYNPKLQTFVRCNNLYEALKLKKVGATVVASGEAEVGIALAEALSNKNKQGLNTEARITLRNRLYEINEYGNESESKKIKSDKAMIFLSSLHKGTIITNLNARTKDAAFKEIIEKLSQEFKIKNKDEFYKRIIEREEIANTYMDKGIAIPHARTNSISDIIISLAISQKGIDWNAPDDKPVHIIVLIGAHTSLNDKYIFLLSEIASVFNDPEFISGIMQCPDSKEIFKMIEEREKRFLVKKENG